MAMTSGNTIIGLESGWEGWEVMQKAITKLKQILEDDIVPEGQFSIKEHMILYTTISNRCSSTLPWYYSRELYETYGEIYKDYIQSKVLPTIIAKCDEFCLREVIKRWDNHKVMVRLLSMFFSYLECQFIPRTKLPSLKEVGLKTFRDLISHDCVKDVMIAQIDREREGKQIDRTLMKNVLEIFLVFGMDVYEEHFEIAMLQETSSFYSRKAASWIEENPGPDYMLKVEDCLKKEKERVMHYLHTTTEVKLLGRLEHELLARYQNQLLENEKSGCRALLRDDKVEDLSRMYMLFSRIPQGSTSMANTFKIHIREEVTALLQHIEDEVTSRNQVENVTTVAQKQAFVWKFIDLYTKYFQYVNDCFQSRSLVHKVLREAFEAFSDKGFAGSTSVELLVMFCDNLLKKDCIDKLSDEAIDETFTKVVNLLACINDKDMFVEFYRKKLARRLLFDRSANIDHERSLLTKLKKQCGYQITFKMERMIIDFTLERENQVDFEQHITNVSSHPGIDLKVIVLTSSAWPGYKSSNLAYPAEMAKCVKSFNAFYQSKKKCQKLTWVSSLGTCNIIGNFEKKPIELIVTTYQAVVLLFFNSAKRLSYLDIKCLSGMTHEDNVRVLHSLSCAKYKVIKKEPNTKIVGPDDIFVFNGKFTDKMRRIKIPVPPVDETKKVLETVGKDRRYAIDSSVVRIMKSRKILLHKELVSYCVEQLDGMFKPDVKAIKQRIEDLIRREYLERDRDDPNKLRYIA